MKVKYERYSWRKAYCYVREIPGDFTDKSAFIKSDYLDLSNVLDGSLKVVVERLTQISNMPGFEDAELEVDNSGEVIIYTTEIETDEAYAARIEEEERLYAHQELMKKQQIDAEKRKRAAIAAKEKEGRRKTYEALKKEFG